MAVALAVGGAFVVRAIDDAETVRAVDDGSAPAVDEPLESWQLDLTDLPTGWTAELTDVVVPGDTSGPSALHRYELTCPDDSAHLMVVPGSFDLDVDRLVPLRRVNRVIDAELSSTGGHVTPTWNERISVGVMLSAELPEEAAVDLAAALRFRRTKRVGVESPESSDGTFDSTRGEVVAGGEVDGLPWRWWLSSDGLQAAIELDGIATDGGTYDRRSIGLLAGRATLHVLAADGVQVALVASAGTKDQVTLVHVGGGLDAIPTMSTADGRLTWAAFPVPRDVEVAHVEVSRPAAGPNLIIELPPLPETGWVRGQIDSDVSSGRILVPDG